MYVVIDIFFREELQQFIGSGNLNHYEFTDLNCDPKFDSENHLSNHTGEIHGGQIESANQQPDDSATIDPSATTDPHPPDVRIIVHV